MKKYYLLGSLFLMTGTLSEAKEETTNSLDSVDVEIIGVDGCLREGRVSNMTIQLTNRGNKDFEGCFGIITDDVFYNSQNEVDSIGQQSGATDLPSLLSVKAKQTSVQNLRIAYRNSAGRKKLQLWQYDSDGRDAWLMPVALVDSIIVDIKEFQEPQLDVRMELDMVSYTDTCNVLYGDVLQGTVTITNNDDDTYYDYVEKGGALIIGGLSLNIYKKEKEEESYLLHHQIMQLPDTIGPHETIVKDFTLNPSIFNFDYKVEYVAVVNYWRRINGDPSVDTVIGDLMAYAGRTEFLTQNKSTNVLHYWTKDGKVKKLEWDEEIKIPAEAVAVDLRGVDNVNMPVDIDPSEANPNCLFYYNNSDHIDKNTVGRIVIRGGKTDLLTITEGYDFYAPMRFEATAVYYERPSLSGGSSAGHWDTVFLPFDVKNIYMIEHADDRRICIGECVSALDENNILFRKINIDEENLKAYHPYIIRYIRPIEVAFISDATTILRTHDTSIACGSYMFKGSTCSNKDVMNGYFMPEEAAYGFYFMYDEQPHDTRPFRSWFETTDGMQVAPYVDCVFEVTDGIEEVTNPSGEDGLFPAFSLSGQKVGTARMENGRVLLNGVPHGIYIVNGKKVLVK